MRHRATQDPDLSSYSKNRLRDIRILIGVEGPKRLHVLKNPPAVDGKSMNEGIDMYIIMI